MEIRDPAETSLEVSSSSGPTAGVCWPNAAQIHFSNISAGYEVNVISRHASPSEAFGDFAEGATIPYFHMDTHTTIRNETTHLAKKTHMKLIVGSTAAPENHDNRCKFSSNGLDPRAGLGTNITEENLV